MVLGGSELETVFRRVSLFERGNEAMRDSLQAAIVGRKVLDGLAKARRKALENTRERVAQKQLLVVIAANADRAAGKPTRGRAGRIARKLGGAISERHVKRILDGLSAVSDSIGQTERLTTRRAR